MTTSGTTNPRVKIAGYAQAVQYGSGIEYTNFNPDLVGFQLAAKGGTPLMTLGNFYITTNLEPQASKLFITNKFSNFVTLDDLNLTLPQAQTLLANNATVSLNLDKTNLNNYALFGSLSEFVRVSLEDIITNWPASLFLYQYATMSDGTPINGYTYQNYTYNPITDVSTFTVNNNFIVNNYQLNYLQNGSILNTFNETNSLRNLTVNFASYSILYNDVEYPVLGFTGSTYVTNDFIYLTVQGNVFSGLPVNNDVSYHIKPNQLNEEQFFNALPPFEAYLLNRQVTPIYTASFTYPIKSDNGVIVYVTNQFTWPVSDGYNIDFDTTSYATYAGNLSDISSDNDSYTSDLINRFLVSESISGFDTIPVVLSSQDQDTSGQKVTKTLRIYGAEYDEINNFISGIAFANVVTYDRNDNTPDAYLKQLAQVLGWGLISSVVENDLLAHYVTTNPSTYSGHSVGLTSAQADIELWRRLILNTPWIWKSKGTRKGIEFFLNFIGTPKGLIQFNEYVYKAEAPIDLTIFTEALQLNGLSTDLTQYPIDSDGYPSPLANTSALYYQNNGLWYRETGGSGSTIDITTGNNPHLGPYDGGYAYINQFTQLIPNFSAVTISSQTITENAENLFVNYNLGVIDDYSGATYVDASNGDGSSLSNCVVVDSTIIPSPYPMEIINECGCSPASNDESLSICVSINENIASNTTPCPSSLALPPQNNSSLGMYVYSYTQYNQDGSIYSSNGAPIYNTTPYTTQTCCTSNGGTPAIYNQYSGTSLINSGYVCCVNSLTSPNVYANISFTTNSLTAATKSTFAYWSNTGEITIPQMGSSWGGLATGNTWASVIAYVNTIQPYYTITQSGNVITWTANVYGTVGNGYAYGINDSGYKVSFGALTGGTSGVASASNCGCSIACSWSFTGKTINLPLSSSTQSTYLLFTAPDGTNKVTTPDGCNCPAGFTVKVGGIIDPFTNQVGYGCQVTAAGLADIALGKSGGLYNTFLARSDGALPCTQQLPAISQVVNTTSSSSNNFVTLNSNSNFVVVNNNLINSQLTNNVALNNTGVLNNSNVGVVDESGLLNNVSVSVANISTSPLLSSNESVAFNSGNVSGGAVNQ